VLTPTKVQGGLKLKNKLKARSPRILPSRVLSGGGGKRALLDRGFEAREMPLFLFVGRADTKELQEAFVSGLVWAFTGLELTGTKSMWEE